MSTAPAVTLALNAGSSSVKFALFDADADLGDGLPPARLRGSVTGIDNATARFKAADANGSTLADETWSWPADQSQIDALVAWIENHLGEARLGAVGHRIVHGGRDFSTPVRIDARVLERLEALTPLAPLHQPASLAPIRHLARARAGLPQYACFDTAFHHRLEPPVSRYALPRALEAEGIRRYGFHGLSYEAIATRLAARRDGAERDRIIVAHLGSGASLCALRALRSVDTTMGFTALDGIMMGTRPGALDPGILLYLVQAKGYDPEQLERLLYHESGLLGVSEVSSDMALLIASDRSEAREAVDLFAFLVARHAAALAATLGGLDRFVFTGGIGEHAPRVREAVATRLAWLGAKLDHRANRAGRTRISLPESRVTLEVLPTDEEAMIARHVAIIAGRR